MPRRFSRKTCFALARLGVSIGLLAALWVIIRDQQQTAPGIGVSIDPTWAGLALLLTVPQVCLSAWRWKYTSGRLGLDLPLGRATAEYYLATFLNQILPGGVAGDAARAWRQGRRDDAGLQAAATAVIVERTSGQLALVLVVLAGFALWPQEFLRGLPEWLIAPDGGSLTAVVIGLAVSGIVGLALIRVLADTPLGERTTKVLHDLRRALLTPAALAVQLTSSLAVVLSYVAVYALAGRAIGIEIPVAALATVVPLILLSMAIPITVAGWGIREGTALALAGAAGLTGTQSVAVSVAYGILVLISSLPGAAVLAFKRWAP